MSNDVIPSNEVLNTGAFGGSDGYSCPAYAFRALLPCLARQAKLVKYYQLCNAD